MKVKKALRFVIGTAGCLLILVTLPIWLPFVVLESLLCDFEDWLSSDDDDEHQEVSNGL